MFDTLQEKKIYWVKTRDNILLAFLPCPGNAPLLEWETEQKAFKLTFSNLDGSEEVWTFETDPEDKFFFVGRLLTIPPAECAKLVENTPVRGINEHTPIVRFKDYHTGDCRFASPRLSLCTAALANDFPLDKYYNPLVLMRRA